MNQLLLRQFFGATIFILILACNGDSANRRADRGENFVSDPDHLYFMNARSRLYRSTTVEEGIDVFRHDDLTEGPDLLIRNNWLEDRADLVLNGRIISPEKARRLRSQVQTRKDTLGLTADGQREAVTEVLTDYLRLVGG